MAQLIKLILVNLFLAMIFSHIIQSIEGRHLKLENTNDPSRPYVQTLKYETFEKVLVSHNYVATIATPTPPISPVQTVSQPPPPGHPDGFGTSGPGHSPGIGHSLKGN
ncbi:hypothetical protein R3W88_006740 [Solanum pinnatisectum]|uniref:Transmembrane protein n=1 Tax=Solanum pinnatisectum TaxID=50273 RepID=A0AAV9KJJ7_9SOLN|nr:hypothetical protein R3W88_006740 [Solanum pinnatisectum]